MIRNFLLPIFLILINWIDFTWAEPPTLNLGVISGLSGAAAKWNRYQNMGLELAKEEFSSDKLVINLNYEDSETNTQKAISAFNKLVKVDHVDAVIADDFGFVITPILPLAEKEKVLLVTTSMSDEKYCTKFNKYFYSISSQLSKTKSAFEKFFKTKKNVKSIATYTFDDPEWGSNYKRIWEELAEQYHVKIVDQYVSADLYPDYKSALAKTVIRKPDAIFFAHEPLSFLKTINQLKYKGILVAANNVYETLVDTTEFTPIVEGTYLVDPKISDDFVSRFKKRYNLYPILEAYSGYEALRSIVEAYKISSDLSESFNKVKYQGSGGMIDFSGSHCLGNQSDWDLFQVKNGLPALVD